MRSRSRRRSPPTARLAAVILLLIVSAAAALLVACPPTASRRGQPIAAPAEKAPPVAAPAAPAVAPAASPGTSAPRHPQPEMGLLAVVIDDAGYSLQELQSFLDLPGPLTVAVLPNLPHSAEAARRIVAAGKDLILHCPMEPLGGENPGPGALYTGQTTAQVDSLLAADFATVPGAIGMNNHMGSKATADPDLMTAVLGYLKRRNLIFLDSRTTADTVAPRIAGELGVPILQRDVFVDVDTSRVEVEAAFAKSIAEAADRGSAVVIGHVQNASVAAILRAQGQGLAGKGVRLARLSEVMGKREGDGAR